MSADMDRTTLAAFLRRALARARYKQGISQTEVAARLGFKSGAQITHWINNRSPVPDEHLLTLGSVLQFDPMRVRPSLSRYGRLLEETAGLPTEDLIV